MKKTLIICSLVIAMLCTSCAKSEPALTDSSETVSSAPVSSEISEASSEVSSETPSSAQASSTQASSEPASSETVTSAPPSSTVSSKAPKAESKAQVSSKASTSSKQTASSQPPKTGSSKTESKPVADDTPDFGELMDEAVVDAIIAEGIEYANSKGMTWYEDFSVEDSGYYNPAFSGDGAEIFRRDLFYHIDQLYDIIVNDPYYYEGGGIAYKIVKGEFKKGYWYGYVLY